MIYGKKKTNQMSQVWWKFFGNDRRRGEKIAKILKSSKIAYEKKISLFNWLKNLELGEIPEEDQRVNSLLPSRLFIIS